MVDLYVLDENSSDWTTMYAIGPFSFKSMRIPQCLNTGELVLKTWIGIGMADRDHIPYYCDPRINCVFPASEFDNLIPLWSQSYSYVESLVCVKGMQLIGNEDKYNKVQPGKKTWKETVQVLGDSKTTCASDEIFVRSYGCLLPASDDPLEIKKIFDKLVLVKNDTGRDTKMGIDEPKSSMEVCNGLTCLDLLVNYIESLDSKYGCNIPLLLIDKGDTNDAILKVNKNPSNKNIHTLVQVLMSLKNSGKLDDLISQGKEYVLLLKLNNLAEVVDPKILNYMIQNKIEYCMEVMPTPSSDIKDDDLHSLKSKFKLREIARTQVDDLQESTRTRDEESDETPKSHDNIRLSDTSNVWLDMNAILGIVE